MTITTMKAPIKTYIICLEKNRQTRCDPTFRAWSELGLDLERIPAVTPKDFNLREVVHPYVYSAIMKNDRKTTDLIGSQVEAACAMSHISAWQKIADSNEPGIVLEDDMELSQSKIRYILDWMVKMPKDTDMYLLHYTGINFKSTKRANGFLDVHSFVGGMAYYLTPQTAKKLLRHARPLVFQIDTHMSKSMVMYNFRVRTRPENRLSMMKAFRDNALSTLGGSHLSSSLIYALLTIIVLFLVIMTMGIVWGGQTIRARQSLENCHAK